MSQVNYDSLKVEIDHIKDDIREIKLDQKETNTYYREVIGELKENAIKTTEILNRQTEQQDVQFAQVKSEISELNVKVDTTIENQKVDIMGVLKYIATGIGGLVLGYLGLKMGIK